MRETMDVYGWDGVIPKIRASLSDLRRIVNPSAVSIPKLAPHQYRWKYDLQSKLSPCSFTQLIHDRYYQSYRRRSSSSATGSFGNRTASRNWWTNWRIFEEDNELSIRTELLITNDENSNCQDRNKQGVQLLRSEVQSLFWMHLPQQKNCLYSRYIHPFLLWRFTTSVMQQTFEKNLHFCSWDVERFQQIETKESYSHMILLFHTFGQSYLLIIDQRNFVS